ncbi:MAG: hypothetical protein WBW91_03555 [Candidatus Sulfotelmatobacter sp.]
MMTNNKHEAAFRIAPRGPSLVGVLLAALICTGASSAQSSVALSPVPTAKPAAAIGSVASVPPANAPVSPTAKSPSAGPHDVTKVHGYWIIEVRNADGKVAKHMEFENQLCTSFSDGNGGNPVGGDSILSSLLAGTASAGAWSIVLGASGPIPNPPNCYIQPYFYLSQSGVGASVRAYNSTPPPAGVGVVTQPYGLPAAISCSLDSSETLGAFEAGGCMPFLVESPAPAGQVGISLSAQFNAPTVAGGLTISAVGTQLFTCTGSPGPPRPADCKNLGVDASNLYNQGTPCIVQNDVTGGPHSQISTTWTGCIPGDPSTSTVTTTSYMVDEDVGQNPFSGVVLTGTAGVPGPFTVSGGQTVVINWTLTFQ